LPTHLNPEVINSKATYSNYQKAILKYLGFQKFTITIESLLKDWLIQKVKQGYLPDELFMLAQQYLHSKKTLLPIGLR